LTKRIGRPPTVDRQGRDAGTNNVVERNRAFCTGGVSNTTGWPLKRRRSYQKKAGTGPAFIEERLLREEKGMGALEGTHPETGLGPTN